MIISSHKSVLCKLFSRYHKKKLRKRFLRCVVLCCVVLCVCVCVCVTFTFLSKTLQQQVVALTTELTEKAKEVEVISPRFHLFLVFDLCEELTHLSLLAT
jgi:Sec-independent protein secretion pathway component TatC